MAITVHIEGATARAVRAEMEELLAVGKLAPNATAATSTAPSPGVEGEIVPPAPKRGGGRKKGAEKSTEPTEPIEDAEVVEETAAETEAVEAAGKDGPTVDEVRAALLALNKAKGDEAVFAVLSELGVKNATGIIDAGKGAEAIEKCQARAAAE